MEAKQKVFFQINELLCFCLDSSPLPHPISLSLSLTFLLTLSSGAWAMVIYCLILAMNLSFLYETLTSLYFTWPLLIPHALAIYCSVSLKKRCPSTASPQHWGSTPAHGLHCALKPVHKKKSITRAEKSASREARCSRVADNLKAIQQLYGPRYPQLWWNEPSWSQCWSREKRK